MLVKIGFLTGFSFAFFSGCCTANVNLLPQQSSMLVICESGSQSCAYEKAKEAAEEHCKKKNKSYIVLKETSDYQGADKNAKAFISGASMITGHYASADRHDDYRVKMEFKCK